MKRQEKMSPALTLVAMVRRQSPKAASWRQLNRALQAVLGAAIDAGLPFDAGDFAAFKGFGSTFWIGDGERYYSAAVRWGHTSACQSFEAWRGRPPYLLASGARVAEGSDVEWEGLPCRVLSFGEGCVRLGHYGKGTGYNQAPTRRFTVTAEAWRAEMARRRKAKREAKKAEKMEEGVP